MPSLVLFVLLLPGVVAVAGPRAGAVTPVLAVLMALVATFVVFFPVSVSVVVTVPVSLTLSVSVPMLSLSCWSEIWLPRALMLQTHIVSL